MAGAGGFWPWWLGAVALALVMVGFRWLTGRSLGVSGHWERLLDWRAEREAQRLESPFTGDPEALRLAMIAATREHFGDELAEAEPPEAAGPPPAEPRPSGMAEGGAPLPRVPWGARALFLAMLLCGGWLAAALRGTFQLRFDLGETYAELFGAGPTAWLVLLVGGFLVGFGTRMAGGCTSGHGLNGSPRFELGSLLATALFFGAAVGLSLLLGWRAG